VVQLQRRRHAQRQRAIAALFSRDPPRPAEPDGVLTHGLKRGAASVLALAVQRLGARALDEVLRERVPPRPLPPRPRVVEHG